MNQQAPSLAGLQHVGINCGSVGDSAPAGNSSTVLARTCIVQVFAIRPKITWEPGFLCAMLMRNLLGFCSFCSYQLFFVGYEVVV